MNRSVFKFLRKKILDYSTITEEVDEIFYHYKIECLGFEITESFPVDLPSKNMVTGLLIDRLVENPKFLDKLNQIENRNQNLKELLD